MSRAIGSVTRDKDGYQRLKVADPAPGESSGHGNTRVWCYLHRHIWELNHGTIPPGSVIRFRDGDRNNVRIENLELVSRNKQLRDQRRQTVADHWGAIRAAARHLDTYEGEYEVLVRLIASRLGAHVAKKQAKCCGKKDRIEMGSLK